MKTNNKETTDKPKSYTTSTSSQTSSLSQVYHQPNKNHKLIPSGKNYSKQIISDESSANQNKSTKNDQKIPKEIKLTHPKKRNEEYQNNKTIYTIKYRHNPNKQIWHPALHHQGVWTYNKIKDKFNIHSWEVDRDKPEENSISDDEPSPELFTRNNNNISMSDKESTVDNKAVSDNDLNEDTNVNKDIKEAKRIMKR